MGNAESSDPPPPEELIRRMCLRVLNQEEIISTDAWKCREVSDLTGIDEDLIRRIYEPARRKYFGGDFIEDDYDVAQIQGHDSRRSCCCISWTENKRFDRFDNNSKLTILLKQISQKSSSSFSWLSEKLVKCWLCLHFRPWPRKNSRKKSNAHTHTSYSKPTKKFDQFDK